MGIPESPLEFESSSTGIPWNFFQNSMELPEPEQY